MEIQTTDLKEAFVNICQENCEKMHLLADQMQEIINMKKQCNPSQGKLLFSSARTPEILDEILEKLVNIFKLEANCGVSQARAIADGMFN